jgi:hypothetical protein
MAILRNLTLVLPVTLWLSADADPYRGFNMVGTTSPCCGGEDCRILADGDVAPRPGGYFIRSFGWFVPNTEAQPGPDQRYHVCIFLGQRRCFLTPNPGV